MASHIQYACTAIILCHKAFSRVIAIQWVYINSTVVCTYILTIYTKTCAGGWQNYAVQRLGLPKLCCTAFRYIVWGFRQFRTKRFCHAKCCTYRVWAMLYIVQATEFRVQSFAYSVWGLNCVRTAFRNRIEFRLNAVVQSLGLYRVQRTAFSKSRCLNTVAIEFGDVQSLAYSVWRAWRRSEILGFRGLIFG